MHGEQIKYVCKVCGSENVHILAFCVWSYVEQKWVVENDTDTSGDFCNACDRRREFVEVKSLPIVDNISMLLEAIDEREADRGTG
jgi:hypothetical protein